MGRKRRSFTDEFKAEAVALVIDQGVSIVEVAADLDLTETSLRGWVRAVEGAAAQGQATDLGSAEREELNRLRKEVKLLREERTILKKATMFFARENQ